MDRIEAPGSAPPPPAAPGPQVRPPGTVEPIYPTLARQMRIQGVVQIDAVVAVDGHMRELRVVSGHPLLAPAALEAVRQWIYEPTVLNGARVEVSAPITVNFKLN